MQRAGLRFHRATGYRKGFAARQKLALRESWRAAPERVRMLTKNRRHSDRMPLREEPYLPALCKSDTTAMFLLHLHLAHPLRQRSRAATSPKVGGLDRTGQFPRSGQASKAGLHFPVNGFTHSVKLLIHFPVGKAQNSQTISAQNRTAFFVVSFPLFSIML